MRQDEIIAENSPSPTTNTQINASGTPVSPIDTPLAIYFYKYFEGLKINDRQLQRIAQKQSTYDNENKNLRSPLKLMSKSEFDFAVDYCQHSYKCVTIQI